MTVVASISAAEKLPGCVDEHPVHISEPTAAARISRVNLFSANFVFVFIGQIKTRKQSHNWEKACLKDKVWLTIFLRECLRVIRESRSRIAGNKL